MKKQVFGGTVLKARGGAKPTFNTYVRDLLGDTTLHCFKLSNNYNIPTHPRALAGKFEDYAQAEAIEFDLSICKKGNKVCNYKQHTSEESN